jgi:hypothetical protein
MLQIANDSTTPFGVQQNALIQLKNIICKNWKYGSDSELNKSLRFEEEEKIIVINEEEKDFLRKNIFRTYTAMSNKLLRKQLSECIKKISKFELSDKFAFIIDEILASFSSGEDYKIFAGIEIFYHISKIFSFETDKYKIPYLNAFNRLNDHLLNFAISLIDKMDNKEASYIIYIILKIFCQSSYTDLPDIIRVPSNFEKWMKIHFFVLQKKSQGELIKKTNNPQEIKILEKNIYWKIKKIAIKNIFTYYNKNSKINKQDSEKVKNFKKLIKNDYIVKYLEICLNILTDNRTEYVCDVCVGYVYKILTEFLRNDHHIEIIENNLDIILKENIVQSSFMRSEDIEIYKTDIKDYLLREFDDFDFFFSERENSGVFLREISNYRKKVNKKREKNPCYFENILKYLVTVIETYDNQIKSGNQPDFRIKESGMYLFEKLHDIMIK